MRDEFLSFGTNAVPLLVAELNRRPVREWKLWPWLRLKLPPHLAARLPNPYQSDFRKNAAIWMLGELGPAASNAVPALRRAEAGAASHLDRRARAVIALAKVQPGNAAALSNAVNLLTSGQQTERYFAAYEFGSFTNHPGFDPAPLIMALGDADGDVRASSAISLSLFGPAASNAVPQLRALLGDRYRHVSVGAALALVRIAPEFWPEALAATTKALGRSADMSEFFAPQVFAAAGANAVLAVPFLEAALAGGAPGFPRHRAALALWQITHRATPELVRELARLNESSIEVVVALGEIGPAASNAVPALRELTRVGYRPLGHAAAEALRRITNSPPWP